MLTVDDGGGQTERTLSGTDRVAALLLAMGGPVAQRLLPHFDPDELKLISHAAIRLGAISSGQMGPVIDDFAGQFSAGINLLGSPRAVEELLTGFMEADAIERLMAEPISPGLKATVWERLGGLADGVLAKYLQPEHPQTIAHILNQVEPSCAAATIRHFPAEMREELMRRMLCARRATDAVNTIVSETLNADLLGNGSPVAETQRHEHLAQIMNGLEREEIETILSGLEVARPKAAKALKSMLFSFHDLVRLTDRARATVIEGVATERLVLALRGTDDAFRDAILSTMSARARRMAESELAEGDGASQRDVREARRQIAEVALNLAAQGAIVLDPSKDDTVV